MKKAIKALAVLVFLAAAGAPDDAPAQAPTTEQLQVASLADSKWVPLAAPGIPPGITVSIISGDVQKGPSLRYVKFPAGYVLPTHWHTMTVYDVVLVGRPRYTVEGKTFDLAPGSHVVMPAKTHHQVTCGAESECVFLSRCPGPFDSHVVN